LLHAHSTEEAVQQALALWEERERARVALVASLELADQSLDAGDGETYDAESLHELVASIKQRGLSSLNGR
jgi:Arc/MetJ-type ribon-helix-helix transcriptional regulator